jgi:hypothetical protein
LVPPATWFFGSAPVGTEFNMGDTWQGGYFAFIEDGNHMLVRVETDTAILGRFPMGFLLGDRATITFSQPIHIQEILWHDNDPKVGETGWSFNGIAGPADRQPEQRGHGREPHDHGGEHRCRG